MFFFICSFIRRTLKCPRLALNAKHLQDAQFKLMSYVSECMKEIFFFCSSRFSGLMKNVRPWAMIFFV